MAIPDLDIDLEQNLTLAQVLELSNKLDLSLHEAGPPEPMTGLRGTMLADRILKEREGIGMLIGSAATAVWLKRSKNPAEALEACKDIDVAVLEDTGSPPAPLPELEKFEGGIDWWLPVKDPIEYQD